MRPIDADKILEAHKFETKLIGKDWTIDDLAAAIETAPTLDVMPVVHGRWEYERGDPTLVPCSVCRFLMLRYNTTNYCPNCGAKMDAKHPEPQYPTWGEWLESIGVIKYNNRADSINYLIRPTHKTNTQIPADIAQKLEIEPKEK